MFSIVKKELLSYFGSVFAYVIASIFLLVSSLFLWYFDTNYNFFTIGNASLQSFFNLAPWILMLLIPALTMRSIAEEEQQGTLLWLFTQPISVKSIVLGKFLALFILVIFCLLPTLVYLYSMKSLSLDTKSIDSGAVYSGYLGLLLISSSFISLGMVTSSISQNQVIAYISGVFLCMFAFFGLEALSSFDLLGNFDYFVQKIGFFSHFKSFPKGIVDTRDIAYFTFVNVLCFILTLWLINRKK